MQLCVCVVVVVLGFISFLTKTSH